MMNKNERMNKLNAMGINTNKYFTLDAGDGTTIHVIIDKNGKPVRVDDVIANGIIEDGYVRNTKLHRRWVMAQMFHMLNYKSYDGRKEGYNEALKRFSIKYEFDMMLEEVRVLGKLEAKDKDTFMERSHFFTKDVIAQTMADYVEELKKYVDTIPNKNCKGIPYKRIKGMNVFVADLQKKIYSPLEREITRLKYASNYNEMYRIVRSFMSDMIYLPYDTPKSKAWIDAYKGEGAFYTLKNLVMFHGCGILVDGHTVFGAAAVSILNKRLKAYKGEGWRMFALMKKVIKDNNFDFHKRMNEIYND
jgi:hypothetical protein